MNRSPSSLPGSDPVDIGALRPPFAPRDATTRWFFGLHRLGIRPGLDSIRELLDRMGNPQDRLDAVVVATPNISALRSRWRYFWTGFHNKAKIPLDERRPTYMHHINMISFPEIRYMLHRIGFEVTDLLTNRIKPVSWVYAPLAPLSYLFTQLALIQEEPDKSYHPLFREIIAQMHTKEMLFGETMIVVARKKEMR